MPGKETMMHEVWGMAALWIGLALIATLLSIWFRIATALSEIVVGTVAQLIIGAVLATSLGGDVGWIKIFVRHRRHSVNLSGWSGARSRNSTYSPCTVTIVK